MLEKLFIPTPSEIVSSDTNLLPTPEMSSGLEIIREHSHLAEPDIRHILFSTRSLPHFAACLHSNPRQQDWIQLEAGHGHRLGKPSLKKTIFLLTFVNKRGGGLERASSIKKTIAKIP